MNKPREMPYGLFQKVAIEPLKQICLLVILLQKKRNPTDTFQPSPPLSLVFPFVLFDLFVVIVVDVTQIPYRHRIIYFRLIFKLYQCNDNSLFAIAHPHIAHHPFLLLLL